MGIIMNLITNDGRDGDDMCRGSGTPMGWDHDKDGNTDDVVLCGVNLGDYFDDPNPEDMLSYTHSFLGVNAAVTSLVTLGDGILGANLKAKPATAQNPYPDTVAEIRAGAVPAHEYTPATVEVMATDLLGLWTTQTFEVMRNRRPVILPSDLRGSGEMQIDENAEGLDNAEDIPGPPTMTVVVGTDGDGTVTKDDHHKKVIEGADVFADDDSFVVDADIDDYEIAWHSDSGADVTVYGIKAGTTAVHLIAHDSGDLRSIRHKVTVHVDPAPTLHETNRLDGPITAILEQGQPVLVIDDILQYFDQVIPEIPTDQDADNVVGAGEAITIVLATGGTVCATSDNIARAVPLEVGGVDNTCHGIAQTAETGDSPRWSAGDLVIELKSLGPVEIEITVTEPADGQDVDNATPQQSASLSFELNVQAE
jgi:hypothetical protein